MIIAIETLIHNTTITRIWVHCTVWLRPYDDVAVTPKFAHLHTLIDCCDVSVSEAIGANACLA